VTKDAWIEEMECGLVEPEERWETLRNCERSLKWHGLYERYLLSAFRGMCSGDVSPTDLKAFFAKANPKRLLVAGDPIPVEGKTINLSVACRVRTKCEIFGACLGPTTSTSRATSRGNGVTAVTPRFGIGPTTLLSTE